MFFEIKAPLLSPEKEDLIFINLKKQAISISINIQTAYTFDLKGRLFTAFIDGHTYRRSMDNRVMEIWSAKIGDLKHRNRLWLSAGKKKALLDKIHTETARLQNLLSNGNFQVLSHSPEPLSWIQISVEEAIQKILYYDYERLEADAQKFRAIYQPVGILPPDMYLALVVQVTESCSYNQCNFCYFYKGQPYRVKSLSEFQTHVQKIKEYFGEALALRKHIFMGEANALDLPTEQLQDYFEILQKEFPIGNNGHSDLPSFDGIYSFMSAFHKKLKTVKEFAQLHELGLKRIYIGMETGSNELLRFLNKPSSVERVIQVVNHAKEGNVHVGIIILLGAGGDKFYQPHVQQTVEAIKHMALDKYDFIYLSPMVSLPGTAYHEKVHAENIHPLSPEQIEQQKSELIKGIESNFQENMPKIALYDINQFIY